jgi:hypothetical protein
MVRAVSIAVLFATTSGCGNQSDADIPPELLQAIAERNDELNYPEGNTGGAVGDIATNICFPTWDNPLSQQYDADALSARCLSDYYDPEAEHHRLLFVVSSAIWCQACQVEFGGSGSLAPLREDIAVRSDRGLRAWSGLFQDAQGNPATADDGARWAKAFKVDFPFGVDAEFALGRFAKADAQPLHMLIDTKTMKIVHKATGGNLGLLWEKVDGLLEQ